MTLSQFAIKRFEKSAQAVDQFFPAEAERIAQACHAMALRFQQGGKLLPFGAGNSASDALHVSVEFVHPVLVGKRALPAVALNGGAGIGDDRFVREIASLGRPTDIALGIDPSGEDRAIRQAITAAGQNGLLTILMVGGDFKALSADERACDHLFVVPSNDSLVVQEVFETTYHVLWELVHLFFEDGT